jgi:hypothetical protein
MTFEDIFQIGEAAHKAVMKSPDGGLTKADRARTKAVVEALRDELPRALSEVARKECCGQGNANRYSDQLECCDIPNLLVTTDQVHDAINEILASDGVEGTHGSPELDEDARKLEAMGQDAGMTLQDLSPEVFAPAAPSVCEWTEQGFEYRTVGCNGYGLHAYSNNFKPKRNRCPYCKWPVVIKSEAAR